MTTTDLSALLAAVLREPDEDTVRLVYADALEEAGQEDRAEFIRAQITIERLGKPTAENVIEFSEAFLSSLRLAPIFEEKWHSEFGVGVRSSRGFVCEVRCSAEDWLKCADAIYWHPSQTVECSQCEGQCGWRTYDPSTDVTDWVECERCNAGRIPRPFVPTAHPVREVRLTTPLEPCSLIGFTTDQGELLENVKRLWPGVTFTLPPAPPEPEAPTIPLTGWRCSLRTDSFVPSHYYDLPSHIGEQRSLELDCRVRGEFIDHQVIGRRFGPVTAVDENGNFWSCEAILTGSRMDVVGRLVHTDLTATSTTNPIRLG